MPTIICTSAYLFSKLINEEGGGGRRRGVTNPKNPVNVVYGWSPKPGKLIPLGSSKNVDVRKDKLPTR